MTPLRIVIAGGGTGGICTRYRGGARVVAPAPRHRDHVCGDVARDRSAGHPARGFRAGRAAQRGLKGTSPRALVTGLSLLPLSGVDAWRILSRRRPDLVIGVGGYSSGPVVALAASRRIPTLLLEQNAAPGFTNRTLSHVVSAAAVTFESTVGYFGRRGFVAGNPVRPEFFSGGGSHAANVPPKVLIFGGSQGAHAINVAGVEAAPRLAAHGAGWQSRIRQESAILNSSATATAARGSMPGSNRSSSPWSGK